ncbi:DNA mismatch endonuclease Vsr [Massilia arenosa]|uniref:Very short patch repair endonuclease n=1 Tax=Zemynaea arenosa TaxID=2561931 RepID=A0A4Y9RW98_9BURK|nr:very short patch repair endonuclease [Massilia arenosa]TFW13420.1 DNA mismatch endonuclease Vsr [Massilia arenosa]
MTDKFTAEFRSRIMGEVRAKHTKPELVVRRLLHATGYRYRLHVPNLPGRPDLVFPKRRLVVFINGCFWHLHAGCAKARLPKSRVECWTEKLEGNRRRDALNVAALQPLGWGVMTIWECELQNHAKLLGSLQEFLGLPGANLGAARSVRVLHGQ